MENKIKHLEMIQNVISRMVNMSFMLKGWAVTLVAGIMVLSTKGSDLLFYLIVYVPIFSFWFLDAYYLKEERLYRALYEKVRNMADKDIDFNMKAEPENNEQPAGCYWDAFISKTEIWFYLPFALVTAAVILLITCLV